jgi:hypothetical protein
VSEESKKELMTLPPFEGNDLVPLDFLTVVDDAEQDGLVGRENVDQGDLTLPTLALLQSMSPAVSDAVRGARPGRYMITTSDEVLEPPIRAVAIQHNKSRLMSESAARDAGADSKCRSFDAVEGDLGVCDDCPYSKWGEDNSPPPCSLAHNLTLLLAGIGPVRVRFTKTGFKNGKNFVGNWLMARKNLWHHPVVLTSLQRETTINGAKVKFFVPKIAWDTSIVMPPAMREKAKARYEEITAAFESGRLADDSDTVEDRGA